MVTALSAIWSWTFFALTVVWIWALIAFVGGLKVSICGALVFAAVSALTGWLRRVTGQMSAVYALTQLMSGVAITISYVLAAVAILANALFLILALLRWFSRPGDETSPGLACQSPKPDALHHITFPCSNADSEAAWSTVHDVRVVSRLDENLRPIATSLLAELTASYVQGAGDFIGNRELVRRWYNAVQMWHVPRFIEAQQAMLRGKADETCVKVEWSSAVEALRDMEVAGLECERLWTALYAQGEGGVAFRLGTRLNSNIEALNSTLALPYNLVAGQSSEALRNSYRRLSVSLGQLDDLRRAHGSSAEVACISDERKDMMRSWEEIAGVDVRSKIETIGELDRLRSMRLDWVVVHTPSRTTGADISKGGAKTQSDS